LTSATPRIVDERVRAAAQAIREGRLLPTRARGGAILELGHRRTAMYRTLRKCRLEAL
jgi:hypothetical protein